MFGSKLMPSKKTFKSKRNKTNTPIKQPIKADPADGRQMFQILQDLDTFTKLHIGDADGQILREKIRFLHRKLPLGASKSRVRGLLSYFSRWTKFKIWSRLTDIVNHLTKTILGKTNLDSKPYIVSNRVCSQIDIVPFIKSDTTTMTIKSELKN